MSRAKRVKTRYPGVYKRGDGFDVYYFDASGKRCWVTTQAATAKDAAELRARWQAEAQEGQTPNLPTRRAKDTLGDFAEQVYLPHLARLVADEAMSGATERQYRSDLRAHVLPRWGTWNLVAISVDAIERWQADLAQQANGRGGTLSKDTRLRIVRTLGYVLAEAKRRRRISLVPTLDVRKPSPQRRDPDLPARADVQRLLTQASKPWLATLILLATTSGMRLGELLGLRWVNVHVQPGEVEHLLVLDTVNQGKLRLDWTKGRASNREVVLPAQTAEALRLLSAAQQVDGQPNPHGLVFPTAEGRPWHASNLNEDFWMPLRRATGLEAVTWHTLRYVYTSWVRSGSSLSASVTRQLVGHGDDRTHDRYTRPVPGTEGAIRAALDDVFRGL